MWEDKHARFGKQICIDMFRLDDREHLAVDQFKHIFPYFSGYDLEPGRGGGRGQRVEGGAEPYF